MIVAVTMCRDEVDVLPYTLAHLLGQVDHVIVADNGSVDGTRQWLAGHPLLGDMLTVVDDPEPGYWQARKMTGLMDQARAMGADIVVPFDADEAWTLPPDLAEREFDVAYVTSRLMIPKPSQVPVEDEPNPLARMIHRAIDPEPWPKVLVRPRRGMALQMGNHGVAWDARLGAITAVPMNDIGLRHYQYRTFTQACRKVEQGTAAYEATSLPAGSFGVHWRRLAGLTIAQRRSWWRTFCATPAEVVGPLSTLEPR